MALLVSNGNHKMGKDTLIFNMTSATDCPSRVRGLCQLSDSSKCYAMKAERQYPSVLPYRRRQYDYWSTTTATFIASDLRAKLKRMGGKIKYIRFSEAGDFSTQADINKLNWIARSIPEVVFYGYTARSDLDYFDLAPNLVINGSGFMVSNEFTVNKGSKYVCPGNCRNCDYCKVAENRTISQSIH